MVAVGAGPGKEVVCPATGFLATSMAAALSGATPVFCDVDESLQLDPTKLEALITPRTVAVAPTHHWGTVADMGPIVEIARRRGIKVIEDCAQAPGASYRGKPVGSIGDVGCFSISCYKIIGGGEGGMAVTSDDRLFDRISQLVEAGGLWRPNRFAPDRYPGELFVGTNYRLSELESAVNVAQMRKLEGVVARHRAVHARVTGRLRAFREVRRQKSNDPKGDIGYMFRFFPQTHELGRRIADALRAEGIGASFRGDHGGPDWHVHRDMFPLFPSHAERCRAELCPVAADLYDRCVNVSFDQWWSTGDCDAVADGMNKVFAALCTPAG
jgi:8-amino-3,8-dideoxy-alpha-D-manno-octulosonate transaminase